MRRNLAMARSWIAAGCCLVVLVLAGRAVAQQPPPAPIVPARDNVLQTDWLTSPEAPADGGLSSAVPPLADSAQESAEAEPLVRATSYGSFWTNLVFATQRTNPGSFTLWVFSEEQQGESAMEIDARRSRLGFNVDLPEIRLFASPLQSTGRVEIDFFGEFLTENRAGARLRHAYWEGSNERWRFLVGQTWDVISPLYPGSLNFSAGWAGGNIGFRRAQLRAERTIVLGRHSNLLLQGSLNQDIVEDFPAELGVRRETASYPVIMVRSAWSSSLPGGSERPLVVGISAHYGETGFDFLETSPPPLNLPPQDDARFETWSVNLDLEIPLSAGLDLRGEFFHGANLSAYLGGIGQGVCGCARRPIRTTGGWLEIVKSWSSAWRSHAGAGVDDPLDSDFLFGRSRNQFVFANLVWQVNSGLSTGLEVGWWRTLYQDHRAGLIDPSLLAATAPGEAVTLEWMVRYDF